MSISRETPDSVARPIERSICMSLRRGSLARPWFASSSSVADRASLSSKMAAVVAPKSPYRPDPNERPSDVYVPDEKAVATVFT